MNKRSIGSRYEEQAALYLQEQGYQLLQKNFRNRFGEIDLIALDPAGTPSPDGRVPGELVFTEVKYRTTGACGAGEEHVDARKQQTIARVAEYYLLKTGLTEAYCRFDVIAIDGTGALTHLKNAFEKQV